MRSSLGSRSRRAKATALALTVSLLALSAGIWALPPLHTWAPGPSPLEVELATERARGADLKRQVDDLSARKPQPRAEDTEQQARADDLKRRYLEAEEALQRPRPVPPDEAERARARALKAQLDTATAALQRGRPPLTDPSQRARADDLAAQNDRLTLELTRPRPDLQLAVTATMTKAGLIARRNLFGLYTEQSPFSYAEVDLVQSAVNRQADIVGYFQSFLDPFRPDAIQDTWRHGQAPLLTWESQPQVGAVTPDAADYSLAEILSGRYDAYIHSYAQGIHELGLPLILRFDHEMNGTWYPWSEVRGIDGTSINGNSPGQYAAMWRHVHDIFQAEGANDLVIWLWSPNRVNRISSQPEPVAFYPGDDVVDWIGMSGYNRPADNQPTFDDTYGPTLPLLRNAAPTKPIFLSEIGATEEGGHKPAWINDLFRGLQANPSIIGFGWFNLTVTSRPNGHTETNDWRINSSDSSSQAMALQLTQGGYGAALR